MKRLLLGVFMGFAASVGYAVEPIHAGAHITGFHVKNDALIIYFNGGAGPCGGNGQFPFVIQKSLVPDQFQAMQSAVLFAYASNKLISVFGATCEAVVSLRVFDPEASFGVGNK